MDMEMSGVYSMEFLFVSTPQRSTASGLHSFNCFPFFFFFSPDRSTFISGRIAILKIPNI